MIFWASALASALEPLASSVFAMSTAPWWCLIIMPSHILSKSAPLACSFLHFGLGHHAGHRAVIRRRRAGGRRHRTVVHGHARTRRGARALGGQPALHLLGERDVIRVVSSLLTGRRSRRRVVIHTGHSGVVAAAARENKCGGHGDTADDQ